MKLIKISKLIEHVNKNTMRTGFTPRNIIMPNSHVDFSQVSVPASLYSYAHTMPPPRLEFKIPVFFPVFPPVFPPVLPPVRAVLPLYPRAHTMPRMPGSDITYDSEPPLLPSDFTSQPDNHEEYLDRNRYIVLVHGSGNKKLEDEITIKVQKECDVIREKWEREYNAYVSYKLREYGKSVIQQLPAHIEKEIRACKFHDTSLERLDEELVKAGLKYKSRLTGKIERYRSQYLLINLARASIEEPVKIDVSDGDCDCEEIINLAGGNILFYMTYEDVKENKVLVKFKVWNFITRNIEVWTPQVGKDREFCEHLTVKPHPICGFLYSSCDSGVVWVQSKTTEKILIPKKKYEDGDEDDYDYQIYVCEDKFIYNRCVYDFEGVNICKLKDADGGEPVFIGNNRVVIQACCSRTVQYNIYDLLTGDYTPLPDSKEPSLNSQRIHAPWNNETLCCITRHYIKVSTPEYVPYSRPRNCQYDDLFREVVCLESVERLSKGLVPSLPPPSLPPPSLPPPSLPPPSLPPPSLPPPSLPPSSLPPPSLPKSLSTIICSRRGERVIPYKLSSTRMILQHGSSYSIYDIESKQKLERYSKTFTRSIHSIHVVDVPGEDERMGNILTTFTLWLPRVLGILIAQYCD